MFEKFPLFVVTQNNRQFLLTDVLRRVTISETYKSLTPFLVPYVLGDGETPDMVSYKFYGNSFYHWVLLLVNKMTNPFEDWPVASRFVPGLVHRKYPFSVTVPSGAPYQINDTVTTGPDQYTVVGVTGNAVSMMNTMRRTFITVDTTFTNLRTGVSGLSVISVIDPEEQIHHWEDVYGNWVDESAINATPVTTLDYEYLMNDAKRAILILEPRYVAAFVQDVERLING